MKPKAQPVVVSVQVSAQSNQPTAEEALEWAAINGWHVMRHINGLFYARNDDGGKLVTAPTPLEAIRNAMKGEG